MLSTASDSEEKGAKMANFWPFNYFSRRNQPSETDEIQETTDNNQDTEINDQRGSDLATFRSLANNYPDFIEILLNEPDPIPGPSIPREEPMELQSLDEAQADDSNLSEASRQLRKRRLEQRIANRENILRAREEAAEPIANTRSDPILLHHDQVDITFQRTAHRQERKFGLLVINSALN